MQITDLNSNLLKAMTSGLEVKNTAPAENFADIVKAASVKPELKKTPTVAVDFQERASSVDTKDFNKTASRDINTDGTKSKPTEKPVKNQPQSQKKAKDDTKIENNAPRADNQTAQQQTEDKAPAVTSTASTTDERGEIAPDAAVVGAGLIAAPMPEIEADAVVNSEVAVSTMVVEDNIATQVSENSKLPEPEMPMLSDGESVEQSQIPMAEMTKAPIAMENTLTPTAEKSVLPQNNQVEAQPEDVVIAQEEKIAELLPENTAVAVKVSVKEDKVTDSLTDKPLTPLFDEVVEVEPTTIQDDMSEVQPEVKVESQKAETSVQPQAAVLNVAENVSDVEVEAQSEVVAPRVETASLSSSQVFATGEGARSANVANQNTAADTSFKDVYDKGLTREVAEQIKVNITQSAIKGVDKIEIQLKPAELGHLEIKMQISKDGRLQAHIVASDANTMELLQKDLSSLKQAFDNAGFQTEDGSFSFSYRGDEQNNNERERLRTFIGEVIAQDVAEETAANDYIGADGVNIRV